MSSTSAIEWTEATWNPTVGCTHVSPGCDLCYAARLASGRLRHRPQYADLAEGGKFNGTVRTLGDRLDAPLRWRKPRRVFVNSMSDLFHEAVPDEFIGSVFDVMARTPQHTYQILTKRHGRMRSLLNKWAGDDWMWRRDDLMWCGPIHGPLPNVWLGVSAENQRWADIRIPALLDTPAAVRFVSAEPLLGPVDLSQWLTHECPACGRTGPWTNGRSVRAGDERDEYWCQVCGAETPLNACAASLHWVITGGESGQGARIASPDWFRSIRDQCHAAGVAYFHKQNGTKRYGRELDGRTWDEYPGGAS